MPNRQASLLSWMSWSSQRSTSEVIRFDRINRSHPFDGIKTAQILYRKEAGRSVSARLRNVIAVLQTLTTALPATR